MLRIPFVQNQFPDGDTRLIEERLSSFLRMLRKQRDKKIQQDGMAYDYSLEGYEFDDGSPVALSRRDSQTIRRRAEKIVKARRNHSGLDHLTDEDMRVLAAMRDGVRLVELGSIDWADELAASLHAEFPWLAAVTTEVWLALRRLASAGPGPIVLPPILVAGPPGSGKSAWARYLAKLCQLPTCELDVGSGSSNFRISGVERGWRDATPGRPLQTIMQHKTANPIVVIDEICKDHALGSGRGTVASVSEGLLSLLEPLTAGRWECPYYRVSFDMRHVNWILTANDLRRVSQPLLSRCNVIEVGLPSAAQLGEFALRQGQRKGLGADSIDAIQGAIVKSKALKASPSLRTVLRMIDRAQALESKPMLN